MPLWPAQWNSKKKKNEAQIPQNSPILNSKSLAANPYTEVRLMCLMLPTIITAVYRVKLLLAASPHQHTPPNLETKLAKAFCVIN